jgi:hypothetical protein
MEQQPKKGPRQASISAFFSPRKPGDPAEPESTSVGAKRPRTAAKSEAAATRSEPPASKKKATAKPKPKAKAKGKKKASPKPKKPKKAPVRFISPHAVVDDEEDDLDDDEDVFDTPEAKRARAELEAGQEVPAGAPISDDAVVDEEDIVDVSEEEEGGAGFVDLTAEEKAESDESAKGWKARSPSVKAATTPTKRPQKKEKAEAKAKAVPAEPLDPAVQARVDTYKLKMEELTKQYVALLHSKQESDAVLQEIYGAALDRDLEVVVGLEEAREAWTDTWQKLRGHAEASGAAEATAAPSTVEFPHEVKCWMVKGLQGRTASLSVVASELLASFKTEAAAAGEDAGNADVEALEQAATLAMEMEIKMLAQRTPHGVRPAKANLFEDTSADALWVWEVGSLEKYFVDDAQKTVKHMRRNRRRLGQQLKTLARVVQLLQQKPVDETKVSAEEAKVGKFGFAVDAELQKAKDREAKEQEKRQAAEDKKQHELERQQAREEEKRKRQQAKDEEKRKREREKEQKSGVSAKRQKQFASFFQSPGGAGTAQAAIDVTGDHELETPGASGESSSAKIARMDSAIGFLRSCSSPPGAAASAPQSIFSSLKGRGAASTQAHKEASPAGWTAHRHRDPKLGVMKLLQFYENARPAYYGTFSARSALFHGGRRPFAQYAQFDYAVDSDDEWEEEEPGESLSDADCDGDESDEDNLDYEDNWLAYEDEVDYLDDAAAPDDAGERGEGPSSPSKHKLPSQLQKRRAKARSVKPAKLEPQVVGPYWSPLDGGAESCDARCPGPAGELLCAPAFESTLMRKAREYEDEQKRLEALRREQQRKKELQQEQDALKAERKKAQEAARPAAATQEKAATTATPQKATPQKAKARTPAASPSTGQTKATSAAATPSPAKLAPPIDSFFKKVDGPVPTPPPASQPLEQGEQKPKDEVISVD